MKCPHCTLVIHPHWYENGIARTRSQIAWVLRTMTCPACAKDILELGSVNLERSLGMHGPDDWRQVFPQGSNRGPVPTEVPAEIASDYNEAASVLALSPKASAALARRCLQSVLRGAGYPQKDLAVQINAALAEADARKAMPTGLHTILDAVRNFGNFAAHRITDQTTLQVIDVEPHEAEFCLDILDAAFDHYYVRPAEAVRMKAALNAKLTAGGKPPAK